MTISTNSWNSRSLADIPERELLELLMADRHWRDRMTGVEGIPFGAQYALGVPLAGLPNSPRGDVDLLLAMESQPEFSTAVQVKRLKVSVRTFRTGAPNKLGELELAARQAELLVKIGFAQVYLYVITVVDSRSENPSPPSYNGLTRSLRSKIEEVIRDTTLSGPVGLMSFTISQPMDDTPLAAGTFDGSLVRRAHPKMQPQHVTDWVRKAMKSVRA